MYQKVCFYIDSKYHWGRGYPDRASRIEFQEETRRLFRYAGWTIIPGNMSGVCDTAVKGKQSLYLHPMDFSGVILAEEVSGIRCFLQSARSFRLRNIGRFDIYQDISDEDYAAYLESRRDEIIADILEHYKTKRRNLYYTGDMSESIADDYRIKRIGDEANHGDATAQYVLKLIDELIADGRLRTAETKSGTGIRTAVPADFKVDSQKGSAESEVRP